MCVSFIGGKNRISKFIIPHIPKNIETYVEPFGGMGWVYLNLKLEEFTYLKTIVYNDFNPLNYNVFNCLKTNPEYLLEVCENIPVEDDDLFIQYQQEIFNNEHNLTHPNYEICYKYLYLLTQVWSGNNPQTGGLIKKGGYTNTEGVYVGKFEIFRKKLRDSKWLNKFKSITYTHNNDYKYIIDRYDSKTTFFYLDPPYFGLEDYYCNHNFNLNSHEELSNKLKTIDGKFALSYYDFPQLEEWYNKDEFNWKEKDYLKTGGAVKGKKQNKSTEILILNYGN